MKKITKDMTISDVIKMDPNTAEIFFEYGMHCIGCPHSSYESLAQASVGHGVDLEALLNALNEYFN